MAAIPAHMVLTVEQEDELIQKKLNNVELPLRRCIRQIAQILAAPPADADGDASMAGAAGSATEDDEAAAAKAAQVWSLFSAQLREVELGVKKVGIVERMESRMRTKYEAKGKQMESNKASLQQEIVSLRAALASAELTRKRKLAYDDVARQVFAVGDRASLQQEIDGHREERAQTASRRDGLRSTLDARKTAFATLLADLKVLRELVPPAEEVEKKEDEEAAEGEETSSTPAAAGSQAPTPAAGEGSETDPKPTTPAAGGADDEEDEDRARRTAPASKVPTPATTTAAGSPAPEGASSTPPPLADAHCESVDSELLNVEAALGGGIESDVAMDPAREAEEEGVDEPRATSPLSEPKEEEAAEDEPPVVAAPLRRSTRSRSPTKPLQSEPTAQDDDNDESDSPATGALGGRPKRGAAASSRKSSTSEPPSKKPRTSSLGSRA